MTTENDVQDSDAKLRYCIDMEWYTEQERSFVLLAASRLCPSSHKKPPKSESGLLNTFKQCCSKWDRFVTPNMPLLEIVFRFFLANSNKPLSLEQIQEKLQQWLNDTSSSRDLSIPRLKRMLDDDRFYGVRPIDEAEEETEETEEPSTSPQID